MIDISRERQKVIWAYRNLWSSFIKVNSGVAIQLEPCVYNIDYEYNRGLGLLSTRNAPPLLLRGWPEQSRSGRSWRRLDICIEINHRIKGDKKVNGGIELVLVESRVKVTYLQHVFLSMYETNTLECHVREVVHYDLAQNEPGHPLFHAQFANDPINGSLINRRYANTVRRLEQIRIATPPMDLRAVLFGLVADHAPWKLADLSQNHLWKSVEQTLPSMPCASIREQINGRMKNTHWYPT